MTHDQLEALIERIVPLLEHQANCCNGMCDRSREAKEVLEEIRWG